jgi:hypothetical protein
MEQSAEFVELWRGLGVDVVGESGEVLRHCPFHHDEDPSLRVDVGRGVWWCFPCNIGGGLRDLRQRATGSADRPPCRGFSIEPKDQASNRESATSLPLCGVNRRMRNRQTAVVMDMQLPCKRYRCERCGPAVRAARLAHYLPAMEGQDWYRVIVSPEQRQTFNKRLTRAGAPSLRVPAEPGRTVVFTTMVFGEVVGDLEQALTSAFAAVPGDGRQVRAAGGLPPMTSGADVDESEWEMLGVVSVSIEESAEIAQACGVFRGWVDERFVPAGGRALLLDDQRPGWAWFCRRTGLHTPQPRRRVTLPPEVATGGVRRR